jgi:hypothetical protein
LAEIPKSNQNNKHSEATADGRNIGEASENEAEHATQKPIHPNDTVEHEPKVDSVRSIWTKLKSMPTRNRACRLQTPTFLLKNKSILDEGSYVLVKLHHQEVPEDNPKLEKLLDTEAHAENEMSLPVEDSEMDEAPDCSPALPAAVCWEKE